MTFQLCVLFLHLVKLGVTGDIETNSASAMVTGAPRQEFLLVFSLKGDEITVARTSHTAAAQHPESKYFTIIQELSLQGVQLKHPLS